MRSRLIIGLGLGLGVSVAIACSSNGSNTLSGGPTTTPGRESDGGCAAMGTAVSDGQGYVQGEGCEDCHGSNMAGSTVALVTGQRRDLVVVPFELG